MKLVLTSIAIALVSSTVAAAAPAEPTRAEAHQPAKIELARLFVELTMPADQFIAAMRSSARMTMAALAEEDEANQERKAAADREVDKLIAAAEPKVRQWLPKMFEAYASAYAREFSAEELAEMVAFAESPAGRHYLAGSDFLGADPGVAAASQALQEELTAIIESTAKDMCAKRAAKRLAAGDTTAKCPLRSASETRAS
jgi:hypothetical protein